MRACSLASVFFLRFPRRGGNYNNTSNAGLGYVNSNNTRGNSNVNYGVRSAPSSPYSYMGAGAANGCGQLVTDSEYCAVTSTNHPTTITNSATNQEGEGMCFRLRSNLQQT